MNSEVEQRIVAMYFDNKDFEKNARKTIDTLGELKDNLNLEDSVKGFDELNKAGKKLNLNDAKTTVRNLKDSLSGLGEKFKSALNIGNGPLHSMRGFFDEFNGYVTKVAGIDLAGKIVNSFESAFRQLTVAPIEAGWNMYQQNIDSTKTIMSGTLKSYKEQMSKTNADWTYDEAEHMEYVKGQLEELSKYAQQTVFSLSDMTSNVGKFTNNNIDLETSVTAMEGIANMTAKAGQGANQASMAMYNFSQALGVGKMTTIDWKSIENANIATTELKDLFIKTAEASGKLTKEVTKLSDGRQLEKYFITVDKNGKKLAKSKWVEISAENFRETLSNGWLDKETMLRVFQLYSNQVKDIDTLAAWGFDTKNEELVKYLFGIGEEAEKAATQVRTFSKMWDAMTESVQSGWAKSMEYIFGDMQEATEFWSTINDKVGEVLDRAAENRNNMLREWRGFTFNENTGEWEKLEGAVDGREDLIQGIYGLINAAKNLGSAFSSAWSDVFGNLDGKKLQEITKGFRDFIDRFKTWLGDMDDSNSRIRKIRTGLSGVFNILKIVVNVIKTGLGVALRVIKPFIDPLLNLFEEFGKNLNLDGAKNLGEILNTLKGRFSELWKKLSSLGFDGIFRKIGGWFSNLWNQISDGVGKFLEDNGLTGVRDWFVDMGDRIKEGYETVKSWWEGSGIPEFFQGIWNSVMDVFTPKEVTRYNGSMMETVTEDAPIVKFFRDLYDQIVGVWDDLFGKNGSLTTWWNGGDNAVANFFSGIYDSIAGLFATVDANGNEIEMPIVTFFKGIYEKIVGAWDSIFGEQGTLTTWWNGGDNAVANFFKGVYDSIAGLFATVDDGGNEIEMPIVTFFKGIYEKIVGVWNSVFGENGTLTAWWNNGNNDVVNFFKGVYDSIAGLFATVDDSGNEIEMPVVTFFKGIYGKIVEAWDSVFGEQGTLTTWWNGGDNSVANFFKGVYDSVMSVFQPKEITRYNGSMLETTFEDSPLVKFFKDIQKFLEEVKTWEIWGSIGDFFSGIWSSIIGFFSGTGETVEAATELTQQITSETPESAAPTTESVGLLERIINAVGDFVKKIVDSVGGITIDPEINKFFVNLGDLFKGMFKILNSVLGFVSKLINGNGTTGDYILTGLGILAAVIVGIVDKVYTLKNNRALSEINAESIASKIMAIGVGLLAISAAIALLSTIPTGDLLKASGVVAVMMLIVGGIAKTLAKKSASDAQIIESTKEHKILEKLIGALEKIGMVAVALALLPEVIRAFGEAKKLAPQLNGDGIMKTLMGLAAFLAGVSLGLALVDKLTGPTGLDPLGTIKTAASIVAFITVVLGGLLAVTAALDGIFGTENIVSTIEHAGEMMNALGGAISGLVGGIIGGFAKGFNTIMDGRSEEEKLNDSMAVLESLGDKLEIFTTDKTAGITRILNLVGLLAQTMKDVPKASDFTKFTDSLEPLASSIMRFALILSGFTLAENQDKIPLESMKERILALVEIMRAFDIPDFSTIVSSGKNKVDYFVQGIDKLSEEMTPERFKALGSFMANLTEAFNEAMSPESKAMQTMSGDLMKNLSAAIKIGMGDGGKYEVGVFDAMPIIDSIVTALGYGETAVATAVHNMVQAGIDNAGGQGLNLNNSELLGSMAENDLIQKIMEEATKGNKSGDLLENNGITDSVFNILYGAGGSKNAPKEDSLLGMMQSLDSFEVPDISSKFTEAFQFKDAKTGQAIDPLTDIRDTLSKLQDEIQQLPEFQITIVPTFDYRNLNSDTLREELKKYPIGLPMGGYSGGGNFKVDMTELASLIDTEGVKTAIAGVSATITTSQEAIVASIDGMGAQINALARAISSLKLYLDTGVLVGSITPLIDFELGKRASKASVTGVVSMFANPYANLAKPK